MCHCRKNWILMIVISILAQFWACDKNDKTLVRIGNHMTISMKDFKEANAYFRKGESFEQDLQSLKSKLDNMIDTKIILLNAYQSGYDQDSTVLVEKHNAEISALLTQLLQTEIVDKFVKESDVRDYYSKNGREVNLRQIFLAMPSNSDSVEMMLIEKSAEQIHTKLKNGESFDILASKFSEDHPSKIKGGLVGPIRYTRPGDPVQEAAFSLNKGSISEVIRNSRGLYILKIDDIRRIKQPPYKEVKNELRDRLRKRNGSQINNAARDYYDSLVEKKHVTWQDSHIDSLLQIIRPWPTQVRDTLLIRMNRLPKSTKEIKLATYDGGEVTIDEFRVWLGLVMDEIIRGGIPDATTIHSMVLDLLKLELLPEMARKKGLEKHPLVLERTKQRMESKMIQLYIEREIWGDIDPGDTEIANYYQAHLEDKYTPSPELEIQEIVVDNENLANEIVALAKQGQNFSKWVQKYSIKPNKEKNNGISKIRSNRSSLFSSADTLLKNEIGKPVKVGENRYSIIKLLNRKQPSPDPLDKIQARVKIHLTNEIKEQKRTAWLSDQRSKVPVYKDEKQLQTFLESIYKEES